jgi:hypothetical protein
MKNQNRMNSQHKKIFMLRKKAIEKNVDHVNLRKTCIFVSTIILSIIYQSLLAKYYLLNMWAISKLFQIVF